MQMCQMETFNKINLPPVLDLKLVKNGQTVLKNLPPVNSKPPPPDFENAADGAPLLLVQAAEHVVIPAKTARGINVHILINPAEHVAIHPVQDDQLDKAVPAVYKHKTQQKAKCLSILYVNLNDNDLTISKGQLVGHGSMCSEKKSSKPVVNVLKPQTIDPAVTEKLWKDLRLDENEILKKNPKVKNHFIHEQIPLTRLQNIK